MNKRRSTADYTSADYRYSQLLELVGLLVPKIVAETLAAMGKQGAFHGVPSVPPQFPSVVAAPAPVVSAMSDMYTNSVGLARAIGLGSWAIQAIKKANKIFASQGREPLIFSGRYSTPAKISAWLQAHPDFFPSRVLAPQRGPGVPRPKPEPSPAS